MVARGLVGGDDFRVSFGIDAACRSNQVRFLFLFTSICGAIRSPVTSDPASIYVCISNDPPFIVPIIFGAVGDLTIDGEPTACAATQRGPKPVYVASAAASITAFATATIVNILDVGTIL